MNSNMQFKKIYANGCSFTCAGGLNWDLIKSVYNQSLNIDIKNHMDYAYPNVLAKLLNVDIINDAQSGGSINRMIRTTYKYIIENKNNLTDTLFILEVPPGWRDEFYSHQLNRTINITSGNIGSVDDETDVANGYNKKDIQKIYKNITNYFYNFVDIDYDMFKFAISLIGLLSFLKLNNINYMLLDCGMFDNFNKDENLPNDYNYIWFEEMSMCNWIAYKKLSITDETNGEVNDGHAGIFGNHLIAENLYHIITNNKKII